MVELFRLAGIAILIGILVALVCAVLGDVLSLIDSALTLILGKFFRNHATLLGTLAALLYFFRRAFLKPLG